MLRKLVLIALLGLCAPGVVACLVRMRDHEQQEPERHKDPLVAMEEQEKKLAADRARRDRQAHQQAKQMDVAQRQAEAQHLQQLARQHGQPEGPAQSSAQVQDWNAREQCRRWLTAAAQGRARLLSKRRGAPLTPEEFIGLCQRGGWQVTPQCQQQYARAYDEHLRAPCERLLLRARQLRQTGQIVPPATYFANCPCCDAKHVDATWFASFKAKYERAYQAQVEGLRRRATRRSLKLKRERARIVRRAEQCKQVLGLKESWQCELQRAGDTLCIQQVALALTLRQMAQAKEVDRESGTRDPVRWRRLVTQKLNVQRLIAQDTAKVRRARAEVARRHPAATRWALPACHAPGQGQAWRATIDNVCGDTAWNEHGCARLAAHLQEVERALAASPEQMAAEEPEDEELAKELDNYPPPPPDPEETEGNENPLQETEGQGKQPQP